ncbi:unnamed protein product [Closterium sp. Yama58-4]|nr:unnamed protein product [Closterium sp. Yama58-4]
MRKCGRCKRKGHNVRTCEEREARSRGAQRSVQDHITLQTSVVPRVGGRYQACEACGHRHRLRDRCRSGRAEQQRGEVQGRGGGRGGQVQGRGEQPIGQVQGEGELQREQAQGGGELQERQLPGEGEQQRGQVQGDGGQQQQQPVQGDGGQQQQQPVQGHGGPQQQHPVQGDRGQQQQQPVQGDGGQQQQQPVQGDGGQQQQPQQGDGGQQQQLPVQGDGGQQVGQVQGEGGQESGQVLHRQRGSTPPAEWLVEIEDIDEEADEGSESSEDDMELLQVEQQVTRTTSVADVIEDGNAGRAIDPREAESGAGGGMEEQSSDDDCDCDDSDGEGGDGLGTASRIGDAAMDEILTMGDAQVQHEGPHGHIISSVGTLPMQEFDVQPSTVHTQRANGGSEVAEGEQHREQVQEDREQQREQVQGDGGQQREGETTIAETNVTHSTNPMAPFWSVVRVHGQPRNADPVATRRLRRRQRFRLQVEVVPEDGEVESNFEEEGDDSNVRRGRTQPGGRRVRGSQRNQRSRRQGGAAERGDQRGAQGVNDASMPRVQSSCDMEFTLRFRVPSVLLRASHSDANIGSIIDASSSAATSLAAECGEGGSGAATIQQPAASHVDYPITVYPQEPLQSAFDKLFLSHLPHCCLPGQQTRQQHDDAGNAKILVEGKGSSSEGEEKQAVRFMAVGQVISSLASLRKHLQQPYVPNMPPYRFGHKPPRFITAYSATVSLSADPLRPPGAPPLRPPSPATAATAPPSAAAEESGAAPSLAQQYRWKVDSAPVVAAEAMILEWLAEPRVGLLLDLENLRRQLAALLHMHEIAAARAATETRGIATAKGNRAAGSSRLWWSCWQCSHCWTRYRRAVSIAAFIVLVAKFPRFVTLWRAHIRSGSVIFPELVFQFDAGRQAQGDCLASLLLQVLGVKGKQQLETGFAAHLLPLLPGGRDAHGQAEGGGVSQSGGTGGVPGEEWREGLRGVEWEEYVERVGEIAAQGGLAGEQYRCCCSQCGEGESTEGTVTGAVGHPLGSSVGRGKGTEGTVTGAGAGGNSSSSSSSNSNSGMVVTGVDPTEFAFLSSTLFCQPMFARAAALIFSDCAGSRHKERVEDAAVEEALRRLAAGGKGAAAPAATAAPGSTGARTKGSGTASGARLVPVNSNAVVGLFTYRVTCLLRWVRLYGFRVNSIDHCACPDQRKPGIALHDLPSLLQRFGAVPELPATTGQEGQARSGWEEFPEGDRAAVAAHEKKDPGEFMGIKTFQVGAFRGGKLDREEIKKEYNLRELSPAHLACTSASHPNPSVWSTVQDNTSGPFFPTLGHRVEEFLRRFAPKKLAREGRNGPLARAITSWAACSGMEERSWAALALGPYAEGKVKPILRSRTEVDALIEMIADTDAPMPACTRCRLCIGKYYLAVKHTSLVASFAYRPSSALLRCLLSLFPVRSATFRIILESLRVPPVPAVVPDSLVAPLLEGVMEERRLGLIYMGILHISKANAFPSILKPIGNDAGGQVEGKKQQQQQEEGEDEWRMWEEVDSWRMAAGNAWPAVEAHDAPLQMGAGTGMGRVQGEESEECCEGMRRAMVEEEEALAAARKGKGRKGRVGAWYLEPWPGGMNPLACLREMLLGETSYCPQAKLDAVAAADGKAGPRGCAALIHALSSYCVCKAGSQQADGAARQQQGWQQQGWQQQGWQQQGWQQQDLWQPLPHGARTAIARAHGALRGRAPAVVALPLRLLPPPHAPPRPPVAFRISSLASLRKHLQQPFVSSMPPFRFGLKPPRFITAYSATVPLSAPPLRPPGGATAGAGASAAAAAASAAAEERAAAPSLADQYRWKVDTAPVVAAEGMMLEWLAEPRVGLLLDLQHLRRRLADFLSMHEIAAARAAARARGTAGSRGTRAAGNPRLWWCCWLCSDCFTRYRRAVSIAAFILLVAKFPRFVTLWRAHVKSGSAIFPHLAFQFDAGRQAQDDCVASLLLQVLGVKGKQQLETGFAAHLLPLLPGGRAAHGQAGGEGGGLGAEGEMGEEWREGLKGVEWEEYVERVGEIAAQGGLAGEQYRCRCSQCCQGESTEGTATGAVGCPPGSSGGSSSGGGGSGMVISGVDPTEFALKCATLFSEPMFANNAAIVFSDCAARRHKESVEDAAVEGAVNRLAAGERSTQGSGVQDRGKRAMESEVPTVSPAATAPGSTGARNKGSSSASGAGAGARLVPVNSNAVIGLFTYRVTCLLRWVRFYGPTVNSSEHCRCYDPQGPGRSGKGGLADVEKDPGFLGLNTFHVGAFCGGGGLDEKEMHKEYNVGRPNLPRRGAASTSHRSPGVGSALRDNSNGHFFPTLGHRVEEFLRRFAPKKLAREGRNGPLFEAITSWAGGLGLGDRAWAALALGPYAEGRIKPILRSRTEVEAFIKLIAGAVSPVPACTRCSRCFCQYYRAVKHTAIAASFAYRPSSALLHCLLSLFPARSATFESLLEKLRVPPVSAAVPDSLVAPLLEGVAEERRLRLLFVGMLHMRKDVACCGGPRLAAADGRRERNVACGGFGGVLCGHEACNGGGRGGS